MILNTGIHRNKNRVYERKAIKMKKYGKVLTAGTLAMGMLLSTAGTGVTAFAASDAEYTKNEDIYVRLAQDGSVDSTHVVNAFTVTKAGEIHDFGDYDKVQNLTDLEPIETEKDEHTFTAEEGSFYYQGDIDQAELPWEFKITYLIDGDEAGEEELAGAEGDLEIRIGIRKNPSCPDEAFFNGCLLQVSLTLDPELCENIQAEGASISDAGADKNITFVVNPQTEADLSVKAEVENFELDDITINGTPAADMPVSYVSAENTSVGKAAFMISADGVKIPEKETEPVQEEKTGLLDKIADLFSGLLD